MAGGVLLQSAAQSGNGNTWDFRGLGGAYNFTVETSDVAVAAGAITLEQAPYVGFAGTWEAITAAITPLRNEIVAYQHVGSLNAVRARISTTVDGPTVTVRVQPPRVEAS
jgi:hypothetical protein